MDLAPLWAGERRVLLSREVVRMLCNFSRILARRALMLWPDSNPILQSKRRMPSDAIGHCRLLQEQS
jgi:hypothetical protein